MKVKLFSFILLTVVLALVSVSAATFTLSSVEDLSKSKNETALTITNPTLSPIDINVGSISSITDGNGNSIAISRAPSGIITIPASSSKTLNFSYSGDTSDFALGGFSTPITILNNDNANDNETLTLYFRSSFCEEGNVQSSVDNRRLEIVSIKDTSSDTDWEWKPLDEVEIDVKIKFYSDDNDDDIDAIVKVALYDTETNDFVEVDDEDELEADIPLDEGNSDTVTITFKVPAEDISDSTSRYKLYVKAYEDGEEETVCRDYEGSDFYQDIEIQKESYQVALSGIKVDSPVPCGQEATISMVANNIGSHDEDKVLVTLANTELNLKMESDVFSLDEGDSQKVSFNFIVPENAEEKVYALKLTTQYKYSSSSKEYREESDSYSVLLKVEGNCIKPVIGSVQISAELASDAVEGEQIVVKATIKNTGEAATTYTILSEGYDAWATLDNIEPSVITLSPGESREATLSLTAKEGSAGEQTFRIKALYSGNTTTQPVSVVIEESQGLFGGLDILGKFKENWFIWVIVLINVILIIAIIIVARKLVK